MTDRIAVAVICYDMLNRSDMMREWTDGRTDGRTEKQRALTVTFMADKCYKRMIYP